MVTGGYGEGDIADSFDHNMSYVELGLVYYVGGGARSEPLVESEPEPAVVVDPEKPWWASTEFIVSITGLLGALGAFFGRHKIEEGIDAVKGAMRRK